MSEPRVPLIVRPLDGRATGPRVCEPVTCGVPLPRGFARAGAQLCLQEVGGAKTPLQARVLEHWPDGSIRWALLDFAATTDARGCARYEVSAEVAGGGIEGHPQISVVETGTSQVRVDTGAGVWTIGGAGGTLIADVAVDGHAQLAAPGGALRIEDAQGVAWPVTLETTVEESGPLRTVVRLTGVARTGTTARLDVIVRVTLFAGTACARIAVTIRNPRRARHPGGLWDLGDPGSALLTDVSFAATLAGEAPVRGRAAVEADDALRDIDVPFALVQVSSGGESWRSRVHVNRHGVVPLGHRGYRLRVGATETRGGRATPAVSLASDAGTLGLAMPHFWQNFPKALEVTDRTLVLGLFPRDHGDLHELQGGEQKTHTFYLAAGGEPLAWCRTPLVAHATPAWYAATEALAFLTPAAADPSAAYVDLVTAGIDGPASFEAKRETIDEYGWRHFGDIYADHEAVGHAGDAPLVSHYNNQYDAVAGFATWFLRTGDLRWWTLMQDLAAHVVDIDVYRTHEDKAAYNGGLFWHTCHYRDAGRSTHRSYPSRTPGVPGGGPSSEHAYATGLLLHHLLTGDPVSRETVLGLADWLMAADDGDRSPFRWLASGATGFASASGTATYHGPGRGPGNVISVLLDAHRLSGEARYLGAAEGLIRRCVHPRQDIAALQLQDAERRWFYTVFLQALGKYLQRTRELGRMDAMHGYARDTLLHFARWMADHERPYLEQAEFLEYPNETWAAQDMRKSEVFRWAALQVDGEDRARFLARGECFFEYAVSTLARLPTRTLARPLVLLLTNGPGRAWFVQRGPALPEPGPTPAWPDAWRLEPFVPQRVRAVRNLTRLVILGTVGVALLAAWILREVVRG